MSMNKTIRAIFLACTVSTAVFAAESETGNLWYVSPDGTGGGLSAEDPASLAVALGKVSIGGGEIFLAEGTYPLSETIELNAAVTMTGAGMDKTFFVPAADVQVKDSYFRFFHLSHPDAILEGVTLQGAKGCECKEGGAGGWAVLIDGNGGQMINCRVTQCGKGVKAVEGVTPNATGDGAVAMASSAALVSHCIINNNTNILDSNGGGVYITAGRLENSLIAGNVVNKNGGGILCQASATGQEDAYVCKILNCTIADNIAGMAGGGLFLLGAKAGNAGMYPTIKNSIFLGNRAPNDSGKRAPEWNIDNDIYLPAFTAKGAISYSYFGDSDSVGDNAVTGEATFADPAHGDYTLLPGSCTIDSGDSLALADDSQDLAGISRKIGSAIDLGCYEYDESNVSCGFTADHPSALLNSTITLTASVYGAPEADLTYEWSLVNNSVDATKKTTHTGNPLVVTLKDAGWYTVKLVVKNNASEIASMERADYIHVAPDKMYFAASETTSSVYPWDTPETASHDLLELVEEAVDGTTIVLPEGEFAIEKTIVLDRGITLQGAGVNQTILKPASGMKQRLVRINHPDSVVSDLTIKGARHVVDAYDLDKYGAGVWISAHGGTLCDCRVTDCQNAVGEHSAYGVVAITGEDGLVTRCRIDHNGTSTAADGFYGAVFVQGGRLENSLICKNTAYSGGGIRYEKKGSVRNCTIADNIANKNGGILWIGDGNVVNGMLENLIVNGNNVKTVEKDGNSDWQIYGSEEAAANARVRNCLIGNGYDIGADPVKGDPAFADRENDDYKLILGSVAVDAGCNENVGSDELDFVGSQRCSHNTVDLGCYELDWSVPQCGFTVSPAVVSEGESVTLTALATVENTAATPAYTWTLTGADRKTLQDQSTSVTLTKAGTYDVELTIAGLVENALTARRPKAITVASKKAYLVPEATNAQQPWKTPETASDNLYEMLDKLTDGTTIVIAPGTYKFDREIVVDKALTLSGAGIDKTIFIPASEDGKIGTRLLQLCNSDCVVEGITVKNVHLTVATPKPAGGTAVLVQLGTLRRCRVTGCMQCLDVGKERGIVNLQGASAVVDSCIIDHNTNMSDNSIGSSDGYGIVFMDDQQGGGTLKNCLICDNKTSKGALDFRKGKVYNCTIVNNEAKEDNTATKTCAGAFLMNTVFLRNVILYGNTVNGVEREINSGAKDAPSVATGVSHCLVGGDTTWGENPVSGDPQFVNPAREGYGDYRIRKSSPAHDAGLFEDWMLSETDLDGNPRVDYKQLVDIGCYETPYTCPAMMILIR